MISSTLMHADQSALLVIDVQERLLSHIHDWQRVPGHVDWLAEAGQQVFVVAEAVGSRDPAHKALALARLRTHGISIVCREMVSFEWLEKSGTAQFRDISRNFLR